MFRSDVPASRRVAGGFGDTYRSGLPIPGATQLVGKFRRSYCRICSVVSIEHVCLGSDCLGFSFGLESAVVFMNDFVADIVCRGGSLGHLFNILSATLDDDSAGPVAVAPGSEATRKLKMHDSRWSPKWAVVRRSSP